jgi:RNA polymerase sigma-70 factor, ECF subfamily
MAHALLMRSIHGAPMLLVKMPDLEIGGIDGGRSEPAESENSRIPHRSPEIPHNDDARLIDRLRRGDGDAFEEVVRKFGGKLLATARRYLRSEDDARDAVQDAFLSAARAIRSFKGNSQLSTWLHRILINCALMQLRAKRRRLDADDKKIDGLLPRFDSSGNWIDNNALTVSAHFSLEASETRRIVRRCIEQLPDSYRVVLNLRDIEELDTQEVATLLGVTPNSVKVRLHRARQALKALLERTEPSCL